jgi:hypothetical protein
VTRCTLLSPLRGEPELARRAALGSVGRQILKPPKDVTLVRLCGLPQQRLAQQLSLLTASLHRQQVTGLLLSTNMERMSLSVVGNDFALNRKAGRGHFA